MYDEISNISLESDLQNDAWVAKVISISVIVVLEFHSVAELFKSYSRINLPQDSSQRLPKLQKAERGVPKHITVFPMITLIAWGYLM